MDSVGLTRRLGSSGRYLSAALAAGALLAQASVATAVPPTTLVRVLGRVSAFAQDGKRIAWCSGGVVYLRSAVTATGTWAYSSGCADALAFAGSRVLWDTWSASNTEVDATLSTGGPGLPVKEVGLLGWDRDSPDTHVKVAAAGRAVAYLDADGGIGGGSPARGVVMVSGAGVVHVAGTRFADAFAVSGDRLATVDRLPAGCACDANAAWSPDSARLAFQSMRDGNWEIYTVRRDGGDLRRVTSTPEDEQLVGWSADGTRLAYIRSEGVDSVLFVAASDKADSVRVARNVYAAAWVPATSRLIYESWSGSLYTVSSDGRSRTRLALGKGTGFPSPAPDGRRISFIRDGSIYVANLDGSGVRLGVRAPSASVPVWSPDGGRLAYSDEAGIHVVDVGTADGTLIAPAQSASLPRWSPDGSHVAFIEAGDGATRVAIAAADGSGTRLMHQRLGDVRGIAWSPDGTQLALELGFPGDSFTSKLVTTDVDTGSERDVAAPRDVAVARTTATVRTAATGAVRFSLEAADASAVMISSRFLGVVSGSGARGDLHLSLYDATTGAPGRVLLLPPDAAGFSIAGSRVVFSAGRGIWLYDAATGRTTRIAVAASAPIGLSIMGRRVAWAVTVGAEGWIRSLRLPPNP